MGCCTSAQRYASPETAPQVLQPAASKELVPASGQHHILCVSLVQARHLRAADTNRHGRSSDPYLVVRVELADGTCTPSQQTRVVYATTSPVFNDRFDFDCKGQPPRALVVNVFDYDVASKPDPLGTLRVPITAADYQPGRPFMWCKLAEAPKGELQIQVAARAYDPADISTKIKLDYVNAVGLVTLRMEKLRHFHPGPIATKALGRDVLAAGAYSVKCVLKHGLRYLNSRPVRAGLDGDATAFIFDQDCRVWIKAGQQEYVIEVNAFAVPDAAPTRPVFLGRGYLPTKELQDSNVHVFRLFLHEEDPKNRDLTDREQNQLLADATSVAASTGLTPAENPTLDEDGSGFRATAHSHSQSLHRSPSHLAAGKAASPDVSDLRVAEAVPAGGAGAASACGGGADGDGSARGGGVEMSTAMGHEAPPTFEEHVVGETMADVGAPTAEIIIRGVFEAKDRVEQWFFGRLMKEFDADASGSLDQTEMLAMVHTLGSQMTEAELLSLMHALDTSKDGKLDATELMQWFRSADFHSTPLAYSLLAFLADGKKGLDELVNDVTRVVSSTDRVTNAGAAILSINEADRTVLADRGLKIYDRKTGLLLTEHIPTFVATAINMMYHSAVGSAMTNTGAVRKLLYSMSVREGAKMNDPMSKLKIPDFIREHQISTTEMAKRVDDFQNFNEFFYRELKPSARPITSPEDDSVVVSPADCRMVVYPTVLDASKIWIKGRYFTIEALLGPECADVAPLFLGGSLVLSRLAPQDYHRWHLPVTGRLTRRHSIDGALYTVNPIAIRRNVPDVYTENKREVCLVQTRQFGLVAVVAIGATIVGSINIVLPDGSFQEKGACHGFFAFGGSTVLLLFQPGCLALDRDLVKYSSTPLETYVRVGERIGAATTGSAPPANLLPADDPDYLAYQAKYPAYAVSAASLTASAASTAVVR